MQAAFKANRIGPHHFQGSTGYGHGDLGREALDNVSVEGGGARGSRGGRQGNGVWQLIAADKRRQRMAGEGRGISS